MTTPTPTSPPAALPPRRLRLALARFPILDCAGWPEWAALVERWIAEAATQGAHVLVFPEYAGMALARFAGPHATLAEELATAAGAAPHYRDLHAGWAVKHGVTLVAGSLPVRVAATPDAGTPEVYVNRAFVCTPDGRTGWQDKRTMTRFESEHWGVAPGRRAAGDTGVVVFDTPHAALAVIICYDSEFPAIARAACEAGAEVIVVPSCTDAPAGWHRVATGARARALECQCFVGVAPLVGRAAWSASVDVNVGRAGVFFAPDAGHWADGVVAGDVGPDAPWEAPGWLYADLDLGLVARVRAAGQTLNWRDRDVGPLGVAL